MFFISNSESETETIAYNLAQAAGPGAIYCLRGGLGAGKTVFARGFARGLGYSGRVASPTFCIVNEYEGGKLSIYHFDAYRVNAAGMIDIGFDDYIFGHGCCLIEWADKLRGLIPESAVWIDITQIEGARHIHVDISD
ncbi:MAG: tRNA (adenosine(37)-N6)-threonylcarbamoyltransferase complex ATPase subunit type 1 TsaE [Defluviitaleaceae bacterium]|nr:tRNA (adenosine(37)-N6)-threonylcarbamoyltransferase complex ATPase subunit type 1 TsaE [Defluviitaleaceae bacterium]MCL2835769.1 tRNA (adenosine(37)-N6)-threonylcarbamoyltransferase complex ATPase subunit type 1 TsaE [Defluviitaleaceae bacterium]